MSAPVDVVLGERLNHVSRIVVRSTRARPFCPTPPRRPPVRTLRRSNRPAPCPPRARARSDDADKAAIVGEYRARLARIHCRHFDRGAGSCSFGSSCFYAHVLPDGSRPEVRSAAGATRLVRHEAGVATRRRAARAGVAAAVRHRGRRRARGGGGAPVVVPGGAAERVGARRRRARRRGGAGPCRAGGGSVGTVSLAVLAHCAVVTGEKAPPSPRVSPVQCPYYK